MQNKAINDKGYQVEFIASFHTILREMKKYFEIAYIAWSISHSSKLTPSIRRVLPILHLLYYFGMFFVSFVNVDL